jgi:hypothetical protein
VSMAEPSGPIKVVQVLLLRDQRMSKDLGPTLWAAFQEVEKLYNLERQRVSFKRYYVSTSIPTKVPKEERLESFRVKSGWEDVWLGKSVRGGRRKEGVKLSGFNLSFNSSDNYPRRYEFEDITKKVRRLLGSDASDAKLLVVMDQEISPPENWRYMIWNTDTKVQGDVVNTALISIAPTDPQYWGDFDDADRLAKIKHRVRVASCSVVAEFLRIPECVNPQCFLCSPVESAVQLDQMVYFGAEHSSAMPDVKSLVDKTFLPANSPVTVQKIGSYQGLFLGGEVV